MFILINNLKLNTVPTYKKYINEKFGNSRIVKEQNIKVTTSPFKNTAIDLRVIFLYVSIYNYLKSHSERVGGKLYW